MRGGKAIGLIALVLFAGAACVAAQEAQECDAAALGDLRGKLDAATAQLQAASTQLEKEKEASSSCSTEVTGLKDKLQQAEATLASTSASLKELEGLKAELEAKVEAAPQQSAVAELLAAAQAAKDGLAAAERQLSDATRQLSEATEKLAKAEGETAALKAAVEEAKAQAQAAAAEAQGAQSQAESCASARTSCEGSLKAAAEEAAAKLAEAQSSQAGIAGELRSLKEELARVRAEADAAKAALAHLETAWLPRWAEEAGRSAAASVGPALEQAKQYAAQGSQAAQALWQERGKPAVEQGLALAKTKAAQLNAALEAHAGESWPKAKAAAASAAEAAAKHAQTAWAAAAKHGGAGWAAARKAALDAWNSEALAAVRPALAAGAEAAAKQAQLVVGELEELLISLLSKNNNTVPLARRPYVTYMVYAGFVVPLVAFGLPLLGLRRAPKPRVGESPAATPMSTKKKKRPSRAH